MVRRARQNPPGNVSKPEDKAWDEWFNKLSPAEHEAYLSKLGLDKEDIDKWEEKEGLKQMPGNVKRKV